MIDRSTEISLATDLYQLTMSASYAALHMDARATFSLFVRALPENRSYLVVAGLEEAVRRLQSLRFDREALDYLRSIGQIRADFIDRLADLRFTGTVRAVPEGRVVFAQEPILEVEAPILEAQFVETLIMNAIHFPTLVATKAARCVAVAPGKSLVEFGLRRTPSVDAALAVARASYMCGFAGTSNVLAGKIFGIPVSGTVAHSFIQAFDSEMDAFRAFASTFPGPVTLLIDTYDTEQGARHAAKVGRELAKHGGRLLAVRIDSGDLIGESRRVRRILDEEGLPDVQIIVSGGLDEYDLEPIVASGAPIDAFGVGTSLATSDDAPSLEMAYKLVEFEGRPRLKLSEGKVSLAGSKQVWRRRGPDGLFAGDLIGTADEPPPGPDFEPLLVPVIEHGEVRPLPTLRELRERHREEMAHLPPDLRRLRGQAPYPVDLTPALRERQQATIDLVRARESR